MVEVSPQYEEHDDPGVSSKALAVGSIRSTRLSGDDSSVMLNEDEADVLRDPATKDAREDRNGEMVSTAR